MILCQFIFRPGAYDADFHRLDSDIDAFARSLRGFRGVEVWQSEDGQLVNASYYFDDGAAVRELSAFPPHLEAKQEYQRWYDGYQIVVSKVSATYGDGRVRAIAETWEDKHAPVGEGPRSTEQGPSL